MFKMFMFFIYTPKGVRLGNGAWTAQQNEIIWIIITCLSGGTSYASTDKKSDNLPVHVIGLSANLFPKPKDTKLNFWYNVQL